MNVDKMRRNLARNQRLQVWRMGYKPWGVTPVEPWKPEQRRKV